MSVRPAYDSETEGLVYHVTPTRQAESISDITSETESAVSSDTIWSDEVHDYFITHHGRLQPASENAIRWLPSDNTRRDILRHVVVRYIHGRDYMGPVKEILGSDPGAGNQHHVLEIRTRGGSWVQDMATEFPHVQFRSVDIAPLVPHLPRPNVVFEVYDISEGLLIEDNSQDIVFINGGLDLVGNYQALLLEVHRALRPGGLVHIREFVPGFWDPKDHLKPALVTNPIGCHFFNLVRGAMEKSGADPDTAAQLHQWLSRDSVLWSDCEQSRGFEQICSQVVVAAPYPHAGYPCASHVDPRMIPLIGYCNIVCTQDSIGILQDSGLNLEEAKLLVEAVVKEMKDPERCPLLKWHTVYATKSTITYIKF